MVKRNPYASTTGTIRGGFYPQGATEPDMRREMIATLDGVFPEVAKSQIFALRKMRMDENDELERCPCVSPVTHEPDKDTFCPFCSGEGYYWDEVLVEGYKMIIRSSVGLASKEDLIAPGLMNIPLASFYFRYDIPLNVQGDTSPDKIVELVLREDGSPARPYKRKRIYRIGTLIDFRSDNGKLEYRKIDCYGEKVKFLNGPRG